MKWLLLVAVAVGSAGPLPALPRPSDADRVVRECEDALRSDSLARRELALDRLQALGPKGKGAVPNLIRFLPTARPRHQARAAEILAAYGPAARDALPVLTELLRVQPHAALVDACATTLPALGDPGNALLIRLVLARGGGGRRRAGVSYQAVLEKYPDAVAPVLIDCVDDPTPRVQARASQFLIQAAAPRGDKPAPLATATAATRARVLSAARGWLRSPNDMARECAVAVLLDLDPAALPDVLPTFLVLLRKGEGDRASAALVRRGAPAARALLDLLHEPDSTAALALVHLLAGFPKDVWSVLADGLGHPNPDVRSRILDVLERDGAAFTALRGTILACLGDESAALRQQAAGLIARRDPARSAPALPVLIEGLFGRNVAAQQGAARVLENLGKQARPAVPALLRRTQTGDPETRLAAAFALARIDPRTWPTFVPVAIKALNRPWVEDDSFDRTRHPIGLLGDAGPNAKAALPRLRQLMDDAVDLTALSAAEAVVRIDPAHSADALARLETFLHWSDDGMRFPFRDQSVAALGRLGPLAKPCGPALLEVLAACRRPREACRTALAALAVDPTAGPALDRFRAALKKKDEDDRDVFLEGLARLGPAAAALLPDLITALSSKDSDVRGMAVLTLRNLGPVAAPALPALKELEKRDSEKEQIRKAILDIEGKMNSN